MIKLNEKTIKRITLIADFLQMDFCSTIRAIVEVGLSAMEARICRNEPKEILPNQELPKRILESKKKR
jgi:hypothetical protein